MKVPTWGLIYWPIGMVIVSLIFLPAELYALFTNSANTLSDYSWHELGIDKAVHVSYHTLAWYLSIISWALFVIIITGHIWFRTPS